jgi:hypothetical protein
VPRGTGKKLNLEILDHMDGIEMQDWARAGRVREKWEKYLRGEPKRPSRKKPQKNKDLALNGELGLMLQQNDRLPSRRCKIR